MMEWVGKLNEAERWIYGIIFVGSIGLGVQYYNHFLATRRDRSATLRTAAQKFKAAFAAEISAIRNDVFRSCSFMDALPRYESAVFEIMIILPECHKQKLQKAWEKYCGKGTGVDAETFIAGYSNHPELYPEFVKRFNELHGCLDDLL